MSGRAYLSIGDVLSLLREEFPDVTISKIRFLESQGLVDPERSPSGYRKFYDQDVARLRWVLRKQRDQFLPLRVIRDRLAAAGNGVPPDDDPADAEWPSATGVVPVGAHPAAHAADAGAGAGADADAVAGADADAVAGAGADAVAGADAHGSRSGAVTDSQASRAQDGGDEPTSAATNGSDRLQRAGAAAGSRPEPRPEPRPAASAGVHLEGHEGHEAQERQSAQSREDSATHARPTARPADRGDDKTMATAPNLPGAPSPHQPGASALHASVSGVSLTLAELCAASGLTPQAVAALEACGLLAPMSIAGGQFYDEEALTVAKLVVAFERFGIEPRHLRLFRNAADREVGLIEQVVAPLLRQRNPEARQRAIASATELAGLGQSLRAALVRSELHRQLGT